MRGGKRFEGNINIFSMYGGMVGFDHSGRAGDWRLKLKVQISLQLDEKLMARIDQAANQLTVSRAGLIRMACMEYVDKILEVKVDEVKA